ncbi:MAG TPA: class I SAM-dependent methyltransferase [Elusimicrobiota bacterium]|nr:class I SAM-dependent methyltransferase [Elusimicrobiota bacterium]
MGRQAHWRKVYEERAPDEVSWYRPRLDVSLELIAASSVAKDAGIVDVGGGASTLVDSLLELGYSRLAVLDIAGNALERSRARLGSRAAEVEWIESDVAAFAPKRPFGLWHDRAVFHFMTAPEERRAYVAALERSLAPGGTAILATFATDGPPKCSGLEVLRHDERSIQAELGTGFALLEVRRETHVTPWRTEQRFVYFRLGRLT